MNEYREATIVELYDANVCITKNEHCVGLSPETGGGGSRTVLELSGYDISKFLQHLNIDYASMLYKGERKQHFEALSLPFTTEMSNYASADDLSSIQIRIDGPQLISIRITWKDDITHGNPPSEYTYCGRFGITWDATVENQL